MSRPASTNYVKFTAKEQVVVFKTDRGQLRTNDYGDYFLRELADGRFTCASEDLERQLIDAGYRAGQQVGVTRTQYGHSVIWKVRRVGGETVEMPRRAHEPTRKPAPPAEHDAFPAEKYATPEPPVPVFPEVDGLAPRVSEAAAQVAAPASAAVGVAADSVQPITATDSLLARCLCEAIDAVQAAEWYAAKRGYAVAFGPAEVERLGVSIFIERTRYGAIVDRKPPARQYVNGAAKPSEVRQ